MTTADKPKIEINLDHLTIGDLELFDAFQTGAASQTDMVRFLNRVVVGGASQLPLSAFPEVIAALREATGQMVNPVDGQGKA